MQKNIIIIEHPYNPYVYGLYMHDICISFPNLTTFVSFYSVVLFLKMREHISSTSSLTSSLPKMQVPSFQAHLQQGLPLSCHMEFYFVYVCVCIKHFKSDYVSLHLSS